MFDDVAVPGEEFFFSHVHLHGGPAPVRQYLPELIDLIWNQKINPRKVFDLTLPLKQMDTAPWMNAARLRRCCYRELRTHHRMYKG